MSSQVYIITAKTNLHVGSGSSSYGVIDNLVQRDASDSLPCIYASSLKGAFREYFEEVVEKNAKEKPVSNEIFGAGENKSGKSDNSKGSHVFHQAMLLSIPVRSNHIPFFNAVSPFVIEKLLEHFEWLNVNNAELKKQLSALAKKKPQKGKPIVFSANLTSLKIEDFNDFEFENTINIDMAKKLLGENIVLMSDSDIMYMCSDLNLPIIARNKLDNGESKNLFYEQVLPRECRLWFFTSGINAADKFDENIGRGVVVQIGANATVGYGFCKINNLTNQIVTV